MSLKKFDDDCPGCRPVLIDLKTGKPFPNEHPAMQALNRLWAATSTEDKLAFHAFTCENSRAMDVVIKVRDLRQRLESAIQSNP
jgi:hypothetical protein